MTRYGLRSAGSVPSEVSTGNVAGPSKGGGRKPKRTRSVQRIESKRSEAAEALKKKKRKVTIKMGAYMVGQVLGRQVYIGNLPQGVTEEMLRGHFKECGKIKRTIVRMSTGVMGGSVREGLVRNRCYASMEFGQQKEALRALRLHDSELAGARLVVVPTPGELPEVFDAVEMLMASITARMKGNKGAK